MISRRLRVGVLLAAVALVGTGVLCIVHASSSGKVRSILARAAEIDHRESIWEKIGLSRDREAMTADRAVYEIRAMGSAAIPELVEVATDPESGINVRILAVTAAAEFDDPRAADLLVKMFADEWISPVPLLKKAVARRNRAVTRRLMELAGDPNAGEARLSAVTCLAWSKDTQARELIIAQAASRDVVFRRALLTLLAGHEWANDLTARALREGDPAEKIAVAYAVAAAGGIDKLEAIQAAIPEATGPVRDALVDSANALRAQLAPSPTKD